MSLNYAPKHEGHYEPKHGKRKKRGTGQNFVMGAVILSIAGIIVKIISACFKIPLTNLIGVDGMGYFNSAYTIYNLLITISAAGLAVSVSKIISESLALGKFRDINSVLKAAYSTFIALGIIGGVIVFIFAQPIADLLKNSSAAPALRAVAPAIFFVSFVSVYKGYFQGHSNMVPTAVSNILEVLIKLFCGLGFAYALQRAGYELPVIVAGAVTGVTFGSFVSLLYLIIRQKIAKRSMGREYSITPSTPQATPFNKMVKKFLRVAIPITLGALTSNIANVIDLFLVMRRLNSLPGVTEAYANSLYGAYSAMATTIFNMPSTILLSIGVSALPAISAAFAIKDMDRLRRTLDSGMKMCTLIALPCAVGMSVMSRQILDLLYTDSFGISVAAPLLMILGPAFFFMSCSQFATPVLQAVGRADIPVRNIVIVSVVKVVSNYILIGIPEIGINGAAISNVIMYLLLMILNFSAMRKVTQVRTDTVAIYIKPSIAAALCGISAWGIYTLLLNVIKPSYATIVAILSAVIVYFVTILVSKTLTKDDINFLPKSKKILKILEKKKWIG